MNKLTCMSTCPRGKLDIAIRFITYSHCSLVGRSLRLDADTRCDLPGQPRHREYPSPLATASELTKRVRSEVACGSSICNTPRPFPNDKVLVGYAYILTHPGTLTRDPMSHSLQDVEVFLASFGTTSATGVRLRLLLSPESGASSSRQDMRNRIKALLQLRRRAGIKAMA